MSWVRIPFLPHSILGGTYSNFVIFFIFCQTTGGISKYQEAFFTDEFRQSAEGKSQQATVQRLKQLMHKQVQILEIALALHGNLAPDGVQPLHKRLLERFSQMKQSIHGMDKMRRQFSESIVNTPLPPLPVEKRSMSVSSQSSTRQAPDDLNDDHSNYHMMNFEKEEIYTRPSRLNGNSENGVKTPQQSHVPMQRCISGRDQNLMARYDSGGISMAAPPVPIRPKSAGYGNYDSPEIPPKLSTTKEFVFSTAPPLPPRGVTPDKRVSNPMLNSLNYCTIDYEENDLHSASMIKSPHQKYSVVNIPLEDRTEADIDQFKFEQNGGSANSNGASQVEFRDSGISTTSHDLNYAYICSDGVRTIATSNSQGSNLKLHNDLNNLNDHDVHSENGSNGSHTNVDDVNNEGIEADNPPPIPRKMAASISYGMNHSTSADIFKDESMDQNHTTNGGGGGGSNSAAGATKIDDYCLPKISH